VSVHDRLHLRCGRGVHAGRRKRLDCGTYRFAAESGEGDEAEATLQEVFSDIATDVSGDSVLYQQAGTVINTTQHQFQIDDTVAQTSLSVQLDDVDLSGAESLQELADEDGSTAMTATDSDDVPSVTVYDPDGNEIDPESDPDVERSVIGDTISFQIDDPDPGEWSYEIENPDDEELGYDAEVTGATQTTMDVSTAGDTYYVGSEADLTATLIGPNGVVEGATLEADVVGPNGNERTVTFTERSPGEYTSSVDVDETVPTRPKLVPKQRTSPRQKSVSWTVDADASFSVTQTTTTDIVPGSTDSISVELERDDTGIDDPRTVTVGLAELTRTDGSTVISASDIELSRQTFDLGPNESDVVTVSASVPDDTPSGVYEGNMRLFTDDGAVISDPVTVTVLEDATIELDITDLSDSVTAGETIEIDVVIENTGDVASTGTAELLIDGTLAHTSSVELGPSETEQVTLNYDTTDADVGEDVPVEVQTADMTETVMIEVIESSSEDSDTGGGTVVGPIDPVGTSVVDSMRQTVTDFNQNIEGTTVVLPDTALDSIGFIEDDLSGSLDVFELDETPEYAPPLDDDQPFITGFVVEVDDHLTNESATLTITVPSEQIENAGVDADELTVLYMSDDDYKRLETSVETDEDITVSAQTSGFSTFIITTSDRVDESDDDETVDESDDDETVDESDDDETVDEEDETVDEEDDEAVDESDEEDDEAVDESDEEDDEAVDESDEDTPGFGAVTALIALLAVTLLVTRRRMS